MSLRFFWKDNNLGIVINNVLLPSVVLQTASPPQLSLLIGDMKVSKITRRHFFP